MSWSKKGSEVSTLVVDLQKAFDTLNYSILLKKMESHGLSGMCVMCVKWFKNYLSSFQYVDLKRVQSEKKRINCGVPQGSIDGILLFLIYIRDLPKVCPSSETFVFADVTSINGHQCSDLDLAKYVSSTTKNSSNAIS